LPRLRDEDVLLAAIRDGLEHLTWQAETFAYAESWDEAGRRYKGLKAGQTARILVDGQSVLVKPEAALAQQQADAKPGPSPVGGDVGPGGSRTGAGGGDTGEGTGTKPPVPGGRGPLPPPRELRRFHGSVRLDPVRLGRDVGQIAEEVVQHLTGIVGAEVEITLEIHAALPGGASEKLQRDVTENCRTLRFDQYGFEEA
jgi:hypothetical protein